MENKMNFGESGLKNKENGVRERIKETMKNAGVTENSVAAGDTSTQKRLNNQLSHGGRITLDTILRILEVCPDISADWLLRGEDTYHLEITGAHEVSGQNATVIGNQNLSESFVLTLLSKKDEQIEKLLEIIKEK